MTRKRLVILHLFLSLVILCLPHAAFASEALSIHEYRQQLRTISEQVSTLQEHPEQAGKLVSQIPDEFTVQTSNGTVRINLRHLKDDLTKLSAKDPKTKVQQIESYVQLLEKEADGYESAETNVAAWRQKLNEILGRREFKRVHDPSGKETLLSKLYGWFSRLFGRIHVGGKASFNLLQVIVYVLLGAALLLLLLWTLKRLRGSEEELPAKEIIPFSPSARGWRSWLADARDSAAKQDWRNAIHLAYWAGISFLESGGAWKPNRARTPREYLRLVSTRNARYPALSALTRKFEVVWYGHQEAAEQDYQETLWELEKLGCR
jgi:Domain of unknown function (DUF4129)